MTSEASARDVASCVQTRATVVQAILNRASGKALLGGSTASLATQIDQIFDAWVAVAASLSANGGNFRYGKGQQRLLYSPLSPELPNLDPQHRLFQAGRSMRDVEPSVSLKIRDPFGQLIANTDDN